MSIPSILLCPGQGAQHIGMGNGWFESSTAAAKIFNQADEVLGFNLTKLCFEGPEQQLNCTSMVQAAIYVTSVACYHGLVEEGVIDTNRIAATAGLSLGEFTALHLAGAFDFVCGLKLVWLRGQAMQEAADAEPGGMVVLIGADEEKANEICDAVRGDGVLVPANFNCPGQVVISGSHSACERSQRMAEDFGLRAKRLVVAGAFHSPLMQPAAERLARALDQAGWQTPRVPVLSNVTARHHGHDIELIKKYLVDQLTMPVRWADGVQWMIERVPGRYFELDPGKVLSGLMKRIDRRVNVQKYGNKMPLSTNP